MSKWICRYCKQDTSNVDYDYLVGTDHLACILLSGDDKPIKIENWDKLDKKEFEIRGVPMKIIGTDIVESRYTIDMYEMVNGELFMRVDLWSDIKELSIKIFPPSQFASPPIHLDRYITKDHLKDPSIFLDTVGSLLNTNNEVSDILKYFAEMVNSKNGKTGIVNHVLSSGSTMTFGSASINLW